MNKPPEELTQEELLEAMANESCDHIKAMTKTKTFEVNTVLSACYIALIAINEAIACGVIIHDDWHNVGENFDLNIWLDNSADEDEDGFAPRYAARIYEVDNFGNTLVDGMTMKIL